MVAVFDGLVALLLSLPHRGYIKWLTHHGPMVEGTITNVTQEKREPKHDCYEVIPGMGRHSWGSAGGTGRGMLKEAKTLCSSFGDEKQAYDP